MKHSKPKPFDSVNNFSSAFVFFHFQAHANSVCANKSVAPSPSSYPWSANVPQSWHFHKSVTAARISVQVEPHRFDCIRKNRKEARRSVNTKFVSPRPTQSVSGVVKGVGNVCGSDTAAVRDYQIKTFSSCRRSV